MQKVRNAIKKMCDPDLYELGTASFKGLTCGIKGGYEYGLSIIRKLDDDIINGIKEGPTPAYLDLYHAINRELNEKCNKIAGMLNENGIKAEAVTATVKDSDLDDDYRNNLRYFHSHKMTATCAGLGWIGKTDLLVSFRFGPRVRLASILTAEPVFPPGIPVTKSRCGECRVCVDVCPAHAASGLSWKVGIDRDKFYNPFLCRNYCKSVSRKNLQDDISLCGICLSVCPKGL